MQFYYATFPAWAIECHLAYDKARQSAVLFGGENEGALLGETWFFKGFDWTLLRPYNKLPEDLVVGAQLAYLPEIQTVILFGDYRWKSTDPEDEIQFGDYTKVWTLTHQYSGYRLQRCHHRILTLVSRIFVEEILSALILKGGRCIGI